MVAKKVHTWKASELDAARIRAIIDSNHAENESDVVRKGIEIMIKKYRVAVI